MAAWALSGGAQAQIVPSLDIGNTTAVFDQLDRPLQGTWNFPDTAARVEIRETTGAGGIAPPDPDTGAGNDGLNPLVRTSYMGMGVVGENPGKFSENFPTRIESGKWYYARVYTAAEPSNAMYYANSARFTEVPPDQINVVTFIDVDFGPLQRVDGSTDVDSDGDGIPDDMENTITGTDPTNRDSDFDGFSDWFELHYSEYMSANEPDEPLTVTLTDAATVDWRTIPVPGFGYVLEFTDAMPYEAAFTETVWSGTATDADLSVPVADWIGTNSTIKGFFRVRAVSPDGP